MKGFEVVEQAPAGVEYEIEDTRWGRWRRFTFGDGSSYREYTSKAGVLGLPLVHYTYGRNPETGRRRVAKGLIAVGRLAFGIVAIGHASLGLLAVGQLGVGVLLGLGQLGAGAIAVGQFGLGAMLGVGQFSTGYVAVGQFVWGYYGLGQFGMGKFVWTMTRADAEAVEFFRSLPVVRSWMR